MNETGAYTAFLCMQKTEANVPVESVLRVFETTWWWQKMLDAYVLFPVGAMRHFEAITIAVRFFMLVCNIHFILLLLSLLWLASTGSSLGSLRIFTEFAMWEATEHASSTINLLLDKIYSCRLEGVITKLFYCPSGTTNTILLVRTSDGYISFIKVTTNIALGSAGSWQVLQVWSWCLAETQQAELSMISYFFVCLYNTFLEA